jgi:hypothetical protein
MASATSFFYRIFITGHRVEPDLAEKIVDFVLLGQIPKSDPLRVNSGSFQGTPDRRSVFRRPPSGAEEGTRRVGLQQGASPCA